MPLETYHIKKLDWVSDGNYRHSANIYEIIWFENSKLEATILVGGLDQGTVPTLEEAKEWCEYHYKQRALRFLNVAPMDIT